jgi:amidophosphoribosyltransferase
MHHPQSLYLTYLGIYSLQHRGQEGAGIFGYPDPVVIPPFFQCGAGLVSDVFSQDSLSDHSLNYAMGHVRYSTSGGKHCSLAQPIVRQPREGQYFALSHNGTIPALQERSVAGDVHTDTSRLMDHLLARYETKSPLRSFSEALKTIEGAYSLLWMTPEGLLFARDPWGFRPLVLGKKDGSPVICSETCALDIIDAEFVREIQPGESGFVSFGSREVKQSCVPVEKPLHTQPCVFELIYFARPDSNIFDWNVYEARKRLGRLLASDYQVEADLVISVPDSGVPASLGFSEASGIPWDVGIIRNHYVHRTFIEPLPGFRDLGVKVKHNPIRSMIRGKRLVVIDDSLVRSTTSKKIIGLLRHHGAKEIHLGISSPPMAWPCFYGIDTPSRQELIASNHSVEQIRSRIGADSLGYLSLETLRKSFGPNFCYACFDGRYQVAQPAIGDLLGAPV